MAKQPKSPLHEQAKARTEAARAASLETLREQEQMRPVPSQEDADAHAVGVASSDAEYEQPEGPAQRAADEVATRNAEAQGTADYQTRQVGRPRKASAE